MIAPLESTSEAWGYGLPSGAAEGCGLPPSASPLADLNPHQGWAGWAHRRHPALPSQRRNAEWFLCHNAACRVESYRTQQAEPCPPGCSAQSGTDLSCGSAGRYPLALSGPDGADVAGRKQAQTEHRTVTQTVLTGCAPRNEVAAATTSQADAVTENCFRTDRGSAIHPRVILIRGEPRCLRQSGAVNPSGLAPVVRR